MTQISTLCVCDGIAPQPHPLALAKQDDLHPLFNHPALLLRGCPPKICELLCSRCCHRFRGGEVKSQRTRRRQSMKGRL
ncbi:hypothetical protein BHE74_00032575 [Ensete ventricosum]|nr:hypothetical protein BHE74_00032575 [Ensete ventricosum]